jgi:hypothetical protein
MRSFMLSIAFVAAVGLTALAPQSASAQWRRGGYYYPTYYGGYYNTAPVYYGSPYYSSPVVTSSYYTAPVVTSYYASPSYVTTASYYQPTYATTYTPIYGYNTVYGGYYASPRFFRFR